MSAMFSVQKGVPMPEINRAPKGVRRKYPIDTMAVGEMFFVPNRSCKSVSAYISRISKDIPGKFSARHCFMYEAPEGWRLVEPGDRAAESRAVEGTGVWRTE